MSSKAVISSHGAILKCKCPGCKEHQKFHLTEKVSPSPFILKLALIFKTKEWNIVCQSCDHHHKVPHKEGEAVVTVLKETGENKSEEQVEKFTNQMNQMPFIGELFSQSMGWDCTKCGEEVAYHFQACWNCSAPQPGYSGGNEPPQFIPPMG